MILKLSASLLLVSFMLTGCGEAAEPVQVNDVVETTTAIPSGTELTSRQMQMWAASCALCHINGNGGAPIVGIAEQWQPRLAQGMDTLLQHTLEGLNAMPPLGYCMSCEAEDFTAMIGFMSSDYTQTGTGTPAGDLP